VDIAYKQILRRGDGSRVSITVEVSTVIYSGSFKYKVDVYTCQKGKRTWLRSYDSDNYLYRRMDTNERLNYIKESQLKIVSEEEILETMNKLWATMRPELGVHTCQM